MNYPTGDPGELPPDNPTTTPPDQAATPPGGDPPPDTAPADPPAGTEYRGTGARGQELVSLSTYADKGFLVLYPTETYIREISDRHKVRVEKIEINAEVDTYKPAGGKGRALTRPTLLRISDAAGIRWDPDRSRFTVDEPDRKVFRAVGYIRLADGTFKPVIGHKEVRLDVEIVEAEERAETLQSGYGNNQRAATPEEKATYIRKETLRLKKHAGAMAESKAYNRAIRAALSLRPTYTAEELKKPWAIPRIDFEPDYSNPEIQRQLTERGDAASGSLYPDKAPVASGGPAPADMHRAPLSVEPEDDDGVIIDGEIVEDGDPGPEEGGNYAS